MAMRKTAVSTTKKSATEKSASKAPTKTAGKAAKSVAAKKPTASTAKKAAAKPPEKLVTKPSIVKAAANPVAKKSAAKPVAKSPAKKTSESSTRMDRTGKPSKVVAPKKSSPKQITAKQALANTLALLEAKNEKARQPPTYPSAGDAHTHLHSGDPIESHAHPQQQLAPGLQPEATEGHSLPRGNQGKRDQR